MASDANEFTDSDDDELAEEIMRDKITKERFLSIVESASEGADILKIAK